MKNYLKLPLLALVVLVAWSCQPKKPDLTPEEAKAIAKEAYTFGFPLMMHYHTMNRMLVVKDAPEYVGGFNILQNNARLTTPKDRTVVSTNADTPYTHFWGDIREEPLVFTIPKTDGDRYVSFQLIDLYTYNFDYITTTEEADISGRYLLATADWQGEKPEGIRDIIHVPTRIFYLEGRTQLFNNEDLDNVIALQKEYKMQPLSAYLGEAKSPTAPALVYPVWADSNKFTPQAFAYINFMLSLTDKPLPEDVENFKKFEKIGVGPGQQFELSSFTPEVQKAIGEGIQEALGEMKAFLKANAHDPLASAKIFGTYEHMVKSAKDNYGQDNDYLTRAVAAFIGLYGNTSTEAVYMMYEADADKKPLNGAQGQYTLTFAEGQLPPVKAFWSLTMYAQKTKAFIENPINRYLLNTTMIDDFVRADDGSITLYIQNKSPGADLEANWLPAPAEPFYIILRLYGPEQSVQDGTWQRPMAVQTRKG